MDNCYGTRQECDMAVKIHEYFTHYKHETLALLTFVQVVSGVAASLAALAAWEWFGEPLNALLTGIGALIATNILTTFALFKITSAPLRILTQAIAHVSKDPVVTPPPHINAKRHDASGLKALVQTVYELAVTASPENTEGTPQPAAMLKHLIDTMPCGVIAMGKGGDVLYANKLAPVRPKSDGGFDIELIFEQNDTLATWLADCQANKVRDTHLWLRVASKLPGEDGRRIFDIAGHYQKASPNGVEVTLIAFDRTQIYGADQDDMDFIALAAHELRGPLTVIRGYLDVFNQELSQDLNTEKKELLDRLLVSTERLSGYVNNILNVSRYDRHQFKLHLGQESLPNIMNAILPDLQLRASTQRRTLTSSIPPDLPAIAADPGSLGEVITNLTDNAIKYSHIGGQIIISAAPKEDSIEVTVQDFGIGMPAPVVGSLFSKFYRSHKSRQSVGGTGLGLFICKAIIEAHGGSIWVRSLEGKGSTFGFTVPTYASVADKLKSGDNQNQDITQRSEGWIKNHAMYRR